MDPTLEEVLEVVGVSLGGVVIVGGIVAAHACLRGISAGRETLRMLQVRKLGGVTTLERPSGRDCGMCKHPMDAGDEIRRLSCGHVFHTRWVDVWLRDHGLRCPSCRRIARCVRVVVEVEPEADVVVVVEPEAEVVVEIEPEAEADVVLEVESEEEVVIELAPEADLPQSQEGTRGPRRRPHVVIDMEAAAAATSSAQRPE
uniref:RING-type domain-containing protein n=1 Tax=Leersia perrieri TaxID=77586 RepID=A0A0D9W6G1_9ORYZ